MARVLVVDDEKSIRVTMAAFLEEAGHDVSVAENGRQAEAMLKQDRVDVVLSDVDMQPGDGLELLRTINVNWPSSKVILMTADPSLSAEAVSERGSLSAFLAKPASRETLLQTVESVASSVPG